jgi:glutathione S-transferase
VLMRQAGIAFEEVMLRFDAFDAGSQFKTAIQPINPVGKVPCLVHDGLAVWDSLAIAEYLADTFPDKQLWPQDAKHRARARSICAEMHSGFNALRHACPMNIEASLPHIGAIVLRDQAAVRADLQRLESIFSDLLASHGGPYLFGTQFTIADAYFAPVCMRLITYGLPQSPPTQAYTDHIRRTPGVAQWIDQALLEKDFVAFDEPYRSGR